MALCLGKENDNCKSCIGFEGGNNPDFTVLGPEESSIKIEQIRMMQTKIIEKPIISSKKVYIIDDSQTMTTEAQNCLLKTLEEPPEYVMIILICNNESQLLTTIKSRCTKLIFHNIENQTLKRYLQNKGIFNNISDQILQACRRQYRASIFIKRKARVIRTSR